MNAINKATEAVEKGQAHVQDGIRTTIKQAEEFVSLGQGTFEAVVKSSQVWAAGVQDLAKQVAASAQTSLDETLATFKSLSSVKSPQEALELQTKLARSTLERALADSSRIGDASIKLFEQALAPLAARANVAVEKLNKTAA
jgi:phasin family protein